MRAAIAGFVAVSLALVPAAVAQVNSLNRPGSGARAAGMGNAFIAVSDDGTAASWNPAGLAQLRKPELSLVYSASGRKQSLEGFRTPDRSTLYTSLSTSNSASSLEFASAALPFSVIGRPVTVQVGWRRLYEFSERLVGDITRVPLGTGARRESRLRIDNGTVGNIRLMTVASAVRLTDRLSLGVGMDFYRGRWDDRTNVSELPGISGGTDFNTSRAINKLGGHTMNVGLLLAFPAIRFGAVYHGPLRTGFDVNQMFRSSLGDPVDRHLGPSDGLELRFPRSLGLGVAWLPRPLFRVAVDLTYDKWTEFLIEGNPDTPEPLSGFDGLPPNLSATRNTMTLNAGLERLMPIGDRFLPIRLGFTHEPQGARDPFVREDANQTVLAAGTGLNSNNLKVDVSLEYRWGAYHHSMDLSPVYRAGRAEEFGLPSSPEVQGTTRFQEMRIKLSMIYRIINVEKIGSALKKAFGA